MRFALALLAFVALASAQKYALCGSEETGVCFDNDNEKCYTDATEPPSNSDDRRVVSGGQVVCSAAVSTMRRCGNWCYETSTQHCIGATDASGPIETTDSVTGDYVPCSTTMARCGSTCYGGASGNDVCITTSAVVEVGQQAGDAVPCPDKDDRRCGSWCWDENAHSCWNNGNAITFDSTVIQVSAQMRCASDERQCGHPDHVVMAGNDYCFNPTTEVCFNQNTGSNTAKGNGDLICPTGSQRCGNTCITTGSTTQTCWDVSGSTGSTTLDHDVNGVVCTSGTHRPCGKAGQCYATATETCYMNDSLDATAQANELSGDLVCTTATQKRCGDECWTTSINNCHIVYDMDPMFLRAAPAASEATGELHGTVCALSQNACGKKHSYSMNSIQRTGAQMMNPHYTNPGCYTPAGAGAQVCYSADRGYGSLASPRSGINTAQMVCTTPSSSRCGFGCFTQSSETCWTSTTAKLSILSNDPTEAQFTTGKWACPTTDLPAAGGEKINKCNCRRQDGDPMSPATPSVGSSATTVAPLAAGALFAAVLALF